MAESSKKRRDLRTVSLWKFPPTANAHNKLGHAASLLNLTPVAGGGISHTGNSTLDSEANQGALYQSAEQTVEMQQFEETAQKYGGENAYAIAPNADMWTLTFQDNDFIVVNDLAEGLSIRFTDSAQINLAEKLLAIIEPPKAT